MLRDPVDRLYSQYSQAAGAGATRHGFLPWVEQQLAEEAAWRPRQGAVWHGFYARRLRHYLAIFPAQQLRSYLYEDYLAAPRAVLRDVFTFLEVDPDVPIDSSRRHNVTRQPRLPWLRPATAPLGTVLRRHLPRSVGDALRRAIHRRPPHLEPVERAAVLPIYASDIRELPDLLKRDLSAWMRA